MIRCKPTLILVPSAATCRPCPCCYLLPLGELCIEQTSCFAFHIVLSPVRARWVQLPVGSFGEANKLVEIMKRLGPLLGPTMARTAWAGNVTSFCLLRVFILLGVVARIFSLFLIVKHLHCISQNRTRSVTWKCCWLNHLFRLVVLNLLSLEQLLTLVTRQKDSVCKLWWCLWNTTPSYSLGVEVYASYSVLFGVASQSD